MTLNLTVTTDRRLFQCADYRLVNWHTGEALETETQKIFLFNAFGWTATVCFTGVARTHTGVDVGQWLGKLQGSISMDDSFDDLLQGLKGANQWLQQLPKNYHRRLSFSVGAFVETTPVYALVTNHRASSAPHDSQVAESLSIRTTQPANAKAYVAGRTDKVFPAESHRLEELARAGVDEDRMHEALANLNRTVAGRTDWVSEACITSHLLITGAGDVRVHDPEGTREYTHPFPSSVAEGITRVLDDHFPDGWRSRSATTGRSATSEKEHKVRIGENPDDANARNNYGVFLRNEKDDTAAAEEQYREALRLDNEHLSALCNLANLLWSDKAEFEAAAELYRKAIDADPTREFAVFGYAQFLLRGKKDRGAARALLDEGIESNPESGRLHLLRGEITLFEGGAADAVEDLRKAREMGANQDSVERLYACALHRSRAPVGECIDAYRVALALNPNEGWLHLNLAQLLFILGDAPQARRELREAERLGLDEPARLEANFYRLAHIAVDWMESKETIRSLLNSGARLDWDVSQNVDAVRELDPNKARRLEQLVEVMTGKRDPAALDRLY
jgi:tetratricopeptide (TPR) repeat protein